MNNFWSGLNKPLIVPIVLQGSRRDKKRLYRAAKTADVLQLILPDSGGWGTDQPYGRQTWPDFALALALEACGQLRRKNAKKIILQAAVNQALAYGLRPFFADFVQAGVNAFVFRDLPLEESGDFVYLAQQQQTPLFLQATESASAERLAALLKTSPQGLIVSTARKGRENQEIENLLNSVVRLRKKDRVPLIIEHVLSQAENLGRAYQSADGLLLAGLADLPDRAVPRALQKIRRILAVK
ncbi:MAG: tryptophan synthase subunit alpha [Candidatus Margulisbacteria bacterium]|jgi:hypothetical protein|nr:tryptophan synthase subunit alpha [Candidatus Margulisiibacteriota bacterium]